MRQLNASKLLFITLLPFICSNPLFADGSSTMHFIIKNNIPKDNACIYALPDKTLSIFYSGGPARGVTVNYGTTSPTLIATSNGVFPANLIGLQENTGIPCPDVYAMYPNYGACKPDSYTKGRDNSCLNVNIDANCNVTLNSTCLNPGFELQKGISTDGSYRYRVTGTNVGNAQDGNPICQLSVDWLKNWNDPQNAAMLENHACK